MSIATDEGAPDTGAGAGARAVESTSHSAQIATLLPGLSRTTERPVRVLQVITRLNVGGPARHVFTLGQGLRAQGFELLLVYGSKEPSEGSLEDQLTSGEVAAVKVLGLGRRVRLLNDLQIFWQLTRLIFFERPDVVHTHTAKAGLLGRLAALTYNLTRCRAQRCAVVHTFHGHVFTGYFGPIASHAVRWLERGLALVTDRIITLSPRQKREVCLRYRIAPLGKTEVVEVGTDLDPLLRLGTDASLRDAIGFEPHHVVFGFVGRFAPIKDLSTLVRVFAQVAECVPDARLMLVGDGELRGAIERLVRDLNLTDRVRFTGWVREVEAIYGAMDVAVLTSRNEGTPLALLEAMAAGRPVVATAVGGVADIVSHHRTGILVRPGDFCGLVEAMTRLGRDADIRRRYGLAARRRASTRSSPDRIALEVGRLYARLLADRR